MTRLTRQHLSVLHHKFGAQDERTGDLVEHAQVIRSGNVRRPEKTPGQAP